MSKKTNDIEYEFNNAHEFFSIISSAVSFSNFREVGYRVEVGIHIENGILKILVFENRSAIIVYSSIFDKELISLPEITSVFIELLSDGLIKSVIEYENDK